MSLLDFSRRELFLWDLKVDPMRNDEMVDFVLYIIQQFQHSDSLDYSPIEALAMVKKLLKFEPLTPLTGQDDEWRDVGSGMKQNIRCSRVFKDQSGRSFDIDAYMFINIDGKIYTNSDSSMDVTFPYTPATAYVSELDYYGRWKDI